MCVVCVSCVCRVSEQGCSSVVGLRVRLLAARVYALVQAFRARVLLDNALVAGAVTVVEQ